jgi:hypothetical protein
MEASGKRLLGGVGIDITERKRAEAELKKAKEAAEVANRANAKAATSPTAIPITVSNKPCPRTMRKISLGWAPSASRRPISCLRWATE